jgi:hypothetical protein
LIDRVQRLRFLGFALLAWCQPYYEYAPVTGASLTAPLHATPSTDRDASGELPSTAEEDKPSAPVPAVMLPFMPFFPIPPVDIGRGYDPSNVPPGPGYPPRYQPLSPAYGPGGGH